LLARGEQAFFYGDWEAALGAYQEVFQAGGADDLAGRAYLGIGKTQLYAGQAEPARQSLTGFLEAASEHPQRDQALYLRAQAAAALGLTDQALADLDAYMALRPGLLDSYLQEQAGDLLRQAGDPLAAVARYQAALAAPRAGSTLPVWLKLGHAWLEAGDQQAAMEAFQRVYDLSGDPATKASMNLLIGRALLAQGLADQAYARFLDSVQNYPQALDSYRGLLTLVEAGVPVDEFQRGLVDYHAQAYGPALAAFDRSLTQTPSAAGFYYRGLTKRALGDYQGALHDFDVVIEGYPDDALWDDAWMEKARTLWRNMDEAEGAISTYLAFAEATGDGEAAARAVFAAAEIAEWRGELGRAAELWGRIAVDYGSSSVAYQAAFMVGIMRVRLGEIQAARDGFFLADAFAASADQRAAARLWIGKMAAALGEQDAARQAWAAAQQADPHGYYGLRAGDLLNGRSPFTARPVELNPDLEAARVEAQAWLRANFGQSSPEPLNTLDERLARDPRMQRGMAFWQVGRYDLAKVEFESLRKAVESDAEATYRLMSAFLDLGLYQPAIFAARQILRLAGYQEAPGLPGPRYFNYVRYGLYYRDLIIPQAQASGLDPLLVFSVARQESLFEGFITSYADARGLMQVIPSTGAAIAAQLGWPPAYQSEDLYRPVVSVAFGVHYLAEQFKRFDGDVPAMLAAYNAGPGNALAWKALAGDDPDLFLEVIRLDQPQKYIRRIYEIYRVYQDLYGRED
jgi:soluble lytic murein transglycosylase